MYLTVRGALAEQTFQLSSYPSPTLIILNRIFVLVWFTFLLHTCKCAHEHHPHDCIVNEDVINPSILTWILMYLNVLDPQIIIQPQSPRIKISLDSPLFSRCSKNGLYLQSCMFSVPVSKSLTSILCMGYIYRNIFIFYIYHSTVVTF